MTRPCFSGGELRLASACRTFGFFCLLGCASIPAGRVEQVRRVVAAARDAGAYRCAARELALAQAHLEFAQVDEAHGELERARGHLKEAELNAAAAKRLSLATGCGPTRNKTARDADLPGDRDRDGVLDRVDACPDDSKDLEGHVDEDGCVDADSDRVGQVDRRDLCRDVAEDIDGFVDQDGCLELDNEGSGP